MKQFFVFALALFLSACTIVKVPEGHHIVNGVEIQRNAVQVKQALVPIPTAEKVIEKYIHCEYSSFEKVLNLQVPDKNKFKRTNDTVGYSLALKAFSEEYEEAVVQAKIDYKNCLDKAS